ncbi:carbohydrate ABC transporter permease [Jiangella rhizosphaerae]|uniref:Sugar ABC transporter permease n=1 Tax=Jiangella rhizosphaerae TaxID=2293569 RepID=A0A418KS96_9ACTN|nr:sugar ABC transporter permease [Jiangella rhizosphaerae]RIQ25241.1 sugar ABC transporter permease [Jiangella rhizosphaerae]
MCRIRKWGPAALLVAPSLLAIGVFVYGFLGWNLRVSVSDWRGLRATYDYAGLDNYRRLAEDTRFIDGVQNVVVFTLVFVFGTLVFGFLLALLLERGVRGEAFFRTVFLFPMAISFIATAIIWRWLLSNASGAQETGLNRLFDSLGVGFLANDWFKSDSYWAVASVAIAAGWALVGYIMALFLAGLRGVSDDLREAARVDGASEAKAFWHVVRPMLLPVVMSAIVILAHISLKTFDLIYAMDAKSRKIETPALYMWFITFEGLNFSIGAAIATLLMVGIAAVIVPYIWYSVRSERRP